VDLRAKQDDPAQAAATGTEMVSSAPNGAGEVLCSAAYVDKTPLNI
jgi:hypothetical protein